MTPQPSQILYCYGAWQSLFHSPHNVLFHEGVPDKKQLSDGMLLIIDDLMGAVNQRVVDIFTKYSHHIDVSALFLSQNIFNKNLRTITLNAHYLIIFKSPPQCVPSSALG